MRKVIMMNRVSLDGFFCGPNGEIDWFIHDPEVDKALHEGGQVDGASQGASQPGTLLMGRLTYQMFEAVWPKMAADPNAPAEMRATGQELAAMDKVVFSKTVKEVTWENTRLAKSDPVKEVKALKQGTGPDILIFGSGAIVQQLTAEKLIDDYLFIVTPAIVGLGKPLFKDGKKVGLELVSARNFKSGNVVLHYRLRK